MRNNLVFQKADIAKANITNDAKKDIEKLYTKWADEIGKKAEYYKTKTNASSWLQEQNMRQLQAQLEATSKHIANEVSGIVKDTIYQVSDAVVQANNEWLINLGFPVSGVESAFVSVPDQTVRRLVTGQIYDSGWSLSKSIWGDNEDTLKKLYEIVGQGIAQNMSVYDISKLLEQYVRPERAKQWNLRMADGRKIYPKSVDYNAQRLARTLAQHGYQTSFIAVTEKNPFIIDVIWRANGSRVCELCLDRDGQHFPKDDLPLDHPNGMCVMEPNVDQHMTDKLADWINNPDGTFPEIDEFAKQFGYEAMPVKTLEDYLNKYGNSSLPSRTYLMNATPYQKMEIEKLRKLTGETSNGRWYVSHVYSGNGDNLGSLKEYFLSLHPELRKGVQEVFDKAWVLANCVNDEMKQGWGVTRAYLDQIAERLSATNVPDEYKQAFAKAIKNLKAYTHEDGGLYYRHYTHAVNLSRKSNFKFGFSNGQNTVFHEVGHAIDAIGKMREDWIKSGLAYSTDDDFGFREAMLKDLLNIRKNLDADEWGTYLQGIKDMMKDNDSSGIQDIFTAIPNMKPEVLKHFFKDKDDKILAEKIVTMREDHPFRPRWGHSDKYWQRSNAVNEAASELFANISAATVCKEEMQYMQTYFPNAVNAFGKIISEVIK